MTTAIATPVTTPPTGSRGRRFRGWALLNWVPIVLVFAALIVNGVVTVRHTQALSPLDEWVYLDYTLKIPTQGVVHQGESLGPGALEQMSCFGDSFGRRGEPCGGPYTDPALYPQGGVTSADIYTPIYFAFTWAVGEAIHLVTGLKFLTAARLSGFFWLAGGLVLLTMLMRRFRVPNLAQLGIGLLIMASPVTLWATTYISTDAPTLLAGAAALLFAFRAIDGRRGGWWLVPIAALSIWLKITTIFGIGLAVVVLLIYALWRRKSDPLPGAVRKRLIVIAASTTVAALAAELIWLGIRALIAIGPSPGQGVLRALSLRPLVEMGGIFLGAGTLTSGGWNQDWHLPNLIIYPLILLPAAGVIGVLFMATRSIATKSFGISTAVAAVAFAPILSIAMYFALGSVYSIAPRYGLSLIPAFLLALGIIVRNRLGAWLTALYGVGLAATIVVSAILHR